MSKLNIMKNNRKSAKLIRRKSAIDEQINQILEALNDENKVLKNKSDKYENEDDE